MAKEYFGLNRGQKAEDVVVVGADPSKNVELVVDLAIGMTREEVILAMELIHQKLVKNIWPPA